VWKRQIFAAFIGARQLGAVDRDAVHFLASHIILHLGYSLGPVVPLFIFMAKNLQPMSRTAHRSTQISKCLTVEFNPIPRFLFHPSIQQCPPTAHCLASGLNNLDALPRNSVQAWVHQQLRHGYPMRGDISL